MVDPIVQKINRKIHQDLLKRLGCKKKRFHFQKRISVLLTFLLLFQLIGGVFLFVPPPKQVQAATQTWPFTTSSNYTFNSDKIEISSGQTQLKATSTPVAWYNTSWPLRKAVTIDNTGNANTLTNYQVQISVTYDSDMQADFDDIRFTDSDGATLIDHWLETKTDSTSATFWVEIPSISASSNKTIYMYYGNSTASSISSGDNTFLFFDDFSSELDVATTGWDDHAESPVFEHALGSVVKDGDTYYLYYDTVYGGTSISMATSTDGINFTDATGHNPILNAGGAGEWDDHHIGLPYVWKEDDTFYMAYRGDDGAEQPRKGGLAYSSDGYSWTKIANNPYLVDDSAWVNGGVEAWGVIKIGDTYYQYYSAFGSLTRRIGVMTTTASPTNWSTDTFTQDANNPIFGDYYRCMDVFKYGSYYYAIPTYRPDSGASAQFRLFRDTSPTFYADSREFLGTVKTTGSSGTWNSYFIDMTHIITDNINRDSFPNNELWVYYSGEETDPIFQQGLIVKTDIDAALFLNTSKWNLSEGQIEVNSGNLVLEGTSGTRGLVEQNTNYANSFQYARVRSRFKAEQARATYAYPLSVRTPGSNDNRITLYGNDATDNKLTFRNCKDASCTTTSLVNSDIQTFHTWELLWKANEVKLYQDDTLKAAHTANVPSKSSVVYFREGSVVGQNVEVDWVFLGEYSSPEPSTSVGSEVSTFSTDNPTIQPVAANSLTFTSLSGFTETATKNGGEIKYILSNDDGSTWQYYNSGWTTSDGTYSQANTATEVNTNIATFPTGDGNFLFKAFLHSDGTQLVQLDSVAVAGVPFTLTISTPTVLSSSSIRWSFTDTADDETGFRIYDNTDTLTTSSATADLTYLDETGLSENTQYTGRYVTAYNDYGNSVSSSAASSIYTLADTPTNLAASSVSTNSITLSVDSLPNDISDSSGYYFSRSGANSGWIQTNSWQDTGLSCGTSYTYTIKYRNGDGVETDTISLTQSTSGCGGGGLPPSAYNPPSTPAPSIENPQGGFKILINDDAKITDTRKVSLKLFAGSDTKRMAISNNPDFKGASQTGQISFQSTCDWDLCYWQKECPDGNYTVYAKFYTQWGQPSEVVSDFIILDTTPQKEVVPEPTPEVPEIPSEEEPLIPTEPEIKPKPTEPAPITPEEIPTPPVPAPVELEPDTPIFTSTQGDIVVKPTASQKPLELVTGQKLKTSIKPSKPVKAIKVIIIFKKPKESSSINNNFVSAFVAPVAYAQTWQVAEYTLRDEDGDGIFEGEIKLPEVAGEYVIRTTLYYEDGTIEDIETATLIDPKGYVYQTINGKELRIPNAEISLYVFNSETNQFELWQAQDYDQKNPQTTNKTGEYNFLVPEGKYYLTITAPDYQDYQSEEFEAKEGNVITSNIELTPIKKFNWQWLIFPVILIVGIIIGIFVRTRKKYQ